jgi:hypothetical protein
MNTSISNLRARFAAGRALMPAPRQANFETQTQTQTQTQTLTQTQTQTKGTICVKSSRARRKLRQLKKMRHESNPGSTDPAQKSSLPGLGLQRAKRVPRPKSAPWRQSSYNELGMRCMTGRFVEKARWQMSIVKLAAAALLIFGLSAPVFGQPQDRHGDPLPEGALARFGTQRFRQGYYCYAAEFSPDGKWVACASAGQGICIWDVKTGQRLTRFGSWQTYCSE